jgi:hypothetical protein
MLLAGEHQLLGEKPLPLLLCPPQIPHELVWDPTWAFVMTGRGLTTLVMARPRGERT